MPDTLSGLTTTDASRRYRVSEDKIRAWIKAGLLPAINTASATCARPRYIITPEAAERFEAARRVTTPPKVKRKRRTGAVDYYPD